MALISRRIALQRLDFGNSKFSVVFRNSKVMGFVAATLWLYGLLEVGLAGFFKLTWVTSALFSFAVLAIVGILAFSHFRSGMVMNAPASCFSSSGGQSCSQVGCDSAGGGCKGKFDEEVSALISKMEKDKLRLLFRRRVGIDLILPLFWSGVGLKLGFSATMSLRLGGFAIVVGSLGLLFTRLYLGKSVFSGS